MTNGAKDMRFMGGTKMSRTDAGILRFSPRKGLRHPDCRPSVAVSSREAVKRQASAAFRFPAAGR